MYGVKVRLPHAALMSILFGRGSCKTRLRFIYLATKQHALNLAKFVSIYKTMLLVQKGLNGSAGGKERGLDTFFAGLVGGWLVFGERNAVNEQVVLYVLSRVVTSFLPRQKSLYPPTTVGGSTVELEKRFVPGKPIPPDRRVFEVFAAVTWGMVMYLFRNRREHLAGGMVNSMQVSCFNVSC